MQRMIKPSSLDTSTIWIFLTPNSLTRLTTALDNGSNARATTIPFSGSTKSLISTLFSRSSMPAAFLVVTSTIL